MPQAPLQRDAVEEVCGIEDLSTLLERSAELLLALVDQSEECACSFEALWTNINRYEHGPTEDQVKRWKQRLYQSISEEVVTGQLQLASRTDKRKMSAQRKISLVWHVKPQEILPTRRPSTELSRNSWEALARIAELQPSFDEAQGLLVAQIKSRMRAETGLRATEALMPRDILQVKQKLEEEAEEEEEATEKNSSNITRRKRRKKNKEDKVYAGSHLVARRQVIEGRAAPAHVRHGLGESGSELVHDQDDTVLSVERGRGDPVASGTISNPAEFDSDISDDGMLEDDIDSAPETFSPCPEQRNTTEGETMKMEDLVNDIPFPPSAGPSDSVQSDDVSKEAPLSFSSKTHLERSVTAHLKMDSPRSNQGRRRTTFLVRSPDNVAWSSQSDGAGEAAGGYETEGSLVGKACQRAGDVLDDGATNPFVAEPSRNPRPLTAVRSTEARPRHGQSTATSSQHAVDSSNLVASSERAIASLAPSQMLTSTAIQQLFDQLATPTCKIMDPSFLDENWKPRPIRPLHSQIKMVLLPLHHTSPKHWNLACCYMEDQTIKFYDSFPQQDISTTRERVESFAASLCTQEAHWDFVVMPCSRQGNGVDCGLYVLLAGIYAMSKIPPPTDLADCDCWRFVFRCILRGEISEAEPESTLLGTKSAVTEQTLECMSDGAQSLAAMLSSDQRQLTAFNATTSSLSTIKRVWRERVKQLMQSMQCLQKDLDNAQHDKATYEAIRQGFAQLRKRQPSNVDELTRDEAENLKELEAAEAAIKKLETDLQPFRVGVQSIEMVEARAHSRKDYLVNSLRESAEMVDVWYKRYKAKVDGLALARENLRAMLQSRSEPSSSLSSPL